MSVPGGHLRVRGRARLQSNRRRYGELLIELERKFARWEDLAGRSRE